MIGSLPNLSNYAVPTFNYVWDTAGSTPSMNATPAPAIASAAGSTESTDTAAAWAGSCHCGAVRFEVRTPLTPAARCNCSLCRRRGALMSPSFPAAALRIVSGEGALTCYQFNTRTAEHYFCRHCGIYPFHRTRLDPTRWRVNLGCLDGVDPYGFEATLANGASLSVVEDA
ncbi:MAG: hypothetical protein GAK40_01039 [Burkholderia plantarii]|nr:MAG: hypothetical protein GAK40_01039 [Burkholderia plantarii]